MPNKVVLVDYFDNDIKIEDKLEAHKRPLLHRAFSVFLYNDDKILLQKRAINKYHSGGLIANTCCSHPQKDKDILEDAKLRLFEELNIKIEKLEDIGSFIYYNKFENGLYEYELDHILVGKYNDNFKVNTEEASDAFYADINFIQKDIVENPNKYAVWFLTAFKIFLEKVFNKN